MKRALLAAAMLLLTSSVVLADIYRYIDENGVMHFTNAPTSSKFKLFMRERQIFISKLDSNQFDPIIADAHQHPDTRAAAETHYADPVRIGRQQICEGAFRFVVAPRPGQHLGSFDRNRLGDRRVDLNVAPQKEPLSESDKVQLARQALTALAKPEIRAKAQWPEPCRSMAPDKIEALRKGRLAGLDRQWTLAQLKAPAGFKKLNRADIAAFIRTAARARLTQLEEFGTTASVGRDLFSRYLLPFEAASILLLAAIVGVLLLGYAYFHLAGEDPAGLHHLLRAPGGIDGNLRPGVVKEAGGNDLVVWGQLKAEGNDFVILLRPLERHGRVGAARLLGFKLQGQIHLSIRRRGTAVSMSGQTRSLVAPRSLADVGGSQALAECPTVTRAVGRSATDSEAFWFTAWDWDTQAIWATVRGFFDAYNSGRYDKCLDYVSEKAQGKDTDRLIDLLKQAKSHSEHVSVEAITDLIIAGSRANGTVDQTISSNVTRQNMSFVKEKGFWRISWPILWNDNGFLTED